jgi:hypothetical protein
MRRNIFLRGLGMLLLAVSGCASTGPEIKPRNQEEIWALPPADDRRYCDPPVYPKDVGNDVDPSKGSPKGPLNGTRGFGSPHMSGPGGSS